VAIYWGLLRRKLLAMTGGRRPGDILMEVIEVVTNSGEGAFLVD